MFFLFGRLCFYSILSFPVFTLTFLLLLKTLDDMTVRKYSNLPLYNETYSYQKRSWYEKKLVLIAVESCNLAMVSTMLVLADHLVEEYNDVLDVKFFHYGGAGSFKYEHLLHDSPYEIIKLQPEWKSAEEIDRGYKVIRGEIFDDWIKPKDGRLRIQNELELYSQLRPNLILTGFVLSAKLSSQIANIPHFIAVPPIFVDLNQYVFEHFPSFLLPSEESRSFINFYFNKFLVYIFRKATKKANMFARISVEYSVFPKIRKSFDLIEGDKTLITEIPELIGISQSDLTQIYGNEGYIFTGPLFAKLKTPIPEDLQQRISQAQAEQKRILYFAMGSSGNQDVVVNILSSLNDKLTNDEFFDSTIGLVISPTLRLIQKNGPDDNLELIQNLDSRIYLSEPNLPTHKINNFCDFGIIHGGQGTIQTAVSSGLPFIGVPSSPEHLNNIKMVVNQRSAILVTKYLVLRKNGADNVMEKLKFMMENEDQFREHAERLQRIYEEYDAPKIIGELIMEELQKQE